MSSRRNPFPTERAPSRTVAARRKGGRLRRSSAISWSAASAKLPMSVSRSAALDKPLEDPQTREEASMAPEEERPECKMTVNHEKVLLLECARHDIPEN